MRELKTKRVEIEQQKIQKKRLQQKELEELVSPPVQLCVPSEREKINEQIRAALRAEKSRKLVEVIDILSSQTTDGIDE